MSAFLREEALRIEREYRVSFEVQFLKGSAPVENSPNIIDAFERAAARLGYTSMPLNSGAGHDTMFLRRIWDAGLIFVPSYNGGVTHCPQEFTDYANLAKGADVRLETARIIDREKKKIGGKGHPWAVFYAWGLLDESQRDAFHFVKACSKQKRNHSGPER